MGPGEIEEVKGENGKTGKLREQGPQHIASIFLGCWLWCWLGVVPEYFRLPISLSRVRPSFNTQLVQISQVFAGNQYKRITHNPNSGRQLLSECWVTRCLNGRVWLLVNWWTVTQSDSPPQGEWRYKKPPCSPSADPSVDNATRGSSQWKTRCSYLLPPPVRDARASCWTLLS